MSKPPPKIYNWHSPVSLVTGASGFLGSHLVNVNPVGERACYDESKRYAEALTFEYRRRYGLDAKIIRIFNTYGPRMQVHDGRVVPNFICQALRGEPLTVNGDGSQTRSFVFVDNEIEGIWRALMYYPGTNSEVFNLGNPDEYTILEFARIDIHVTGNIS